jgi:hypothetical protein
MQTQLKTPLTTLGLALASSFGAIAFSTPAYSINVDLATFDSIGDVTNNNTVIQSGTLNTVDVDSLESFLSFTPGSLDPVTTYYGSAIKKTFSFNAGDQFSFDWTSSIDSQDQAFVAINNAIAVLSTGSSYSYTFATAGNYQVAMRVLDFNDSTGVSTLNLSNAQIQAVPWETDALSVVGTTLLFGIGIWKKYKSSNSNNRDLG